MISTRLFPLGLSLAMSLGLSLASSVSMAQSALYEVSITNITPGQSFTPQLVMTHAGGFNVFRYGEAATPGLELLAEAGDPSLLTEEAAAMTWEAATIDGLLGPGETATVEISGDPDNGFISVAAMLLPTNDTFVALSRARLPKTGFSRLLRAYDAGTEYNDQSCQNIPGPRCGGEPSSPAADSDEGFVHISNGFHELGDIDEDGFEVLGPRVYDWRNSVARVVVRRLN